MTVVLTTDQDRTGAAARTGLNIDLFDLLVCPVDKRDLQLQGNDLVCTDCHRHYAIDNGIPNMLVEDATQP